MKYEFGAVLEYDTDGVNVSFPQLESCFTCGHNGEEAMKNAIEALGLHLYGMEEDGIWIPDYDCEDMGRYLNNKLPTEYLVLEVDSKEVQSVLKLTKLLKRFKKKYNLSILANIIVFVFKKNIVDLIHHIIDGLSPKKREEVLRMIGNLTLNKRDKDV